MLSSLFYRHRGLLWNNFGRFAIYCKYDTMQRTGGSIRWCSWGRIKWGRESLFFPNKANFSSVEAQQGVCPYQEWK